MTGWVREWLSDWWDDWVSDYFIFNSQTNFFLFNSIAIFIQFSFKAVVAAVVAAAKDLLLVWAQKMRSDFKRISFVSLCLFFIFLNVTCSNCKYHAWYISYMIDCPLVCPSFSFYKFIHENEMFKWFEAQIARKKNGLN